MLKVKPTSKETLGVQNTLNILTFAAAALSQQGFLLERVYFPLSRGLSRSPADILPADSMVIAGTVVAIGLVMIISISSRFVTKICGATVSHVDWKAAKTRLAIQVATMGLTLPIVDNAIWERLPLATTGQSDLSVYLVIFIELIPIAVLIGLLVLCFAIFLEVMIKRVRSQFPTSAHKEVNGQGQ